MKKKLPVLLSFLKPFQRFTIDVAEDFNPNTNSYQTFARNISKSDIPAELIELSRKYYNGLGDGRTIQKSTKKTREKKHEAYQCKSCFTIYTSETGDEFSNIPRGTLFVDLPGSYTCYTCGAAKSNFEKVEIDERMLKEL